MKKYKIFPLIAFLIILTFGCSAETIQSVKSLNFPLRDDMNLESTNTSTVNDVEIESSTYTVQNGDLSSFLFEYEKNLNEKGWATVNDLKPSGLVVEKSNKTVTILAYEQDNKLMVDILPTPKAKE
ncbi:hypothetical protein [Proteiniborus sp. MB09-C3]|uniref:hypothetical protein n=1 Tax=Proteiniborus sp. MB09-C3 TaxID=3050072 RepID=UPI0025555CCA|nr:hypothetical protein [Proteiniborus sp. MB09-C3]WIV13300.1 hypothetical protein QO263_06205 [Proteiniborus sp. MB09-C3]